MWRSTMLLSATKSLPQMASRISFLVATRPPRLARRYKRLCSIPQVAAEMNVSQSVVAEIESSKADVRYSTLDRYAEGVTKHKKRLDLTPA
jgi:predicted transcriptional regulator